MHPAVLVLTSIASGLAKGLVLADKQRTHNVGTLLHSGLLGPITEELTYRAMPLTAAPHLPRGLTAVPFALAHVSPVDMVSRPGWSSWRVADAGLGGLLYEAAYRRGGMLAAVAAHGGHNLGVALGATLARDPGSRPA